MSTYSLSVRNIGDGFTNSVKLYEINGSLTYSFVEKRFVDDPDYPNSFGVERGVNSYLALLGIDVPRILSECPGSLYMEFIDGRQPTKEELLEECIGKLAWIHHASLNDELYFKTRVSSGIPTRDLVRRISNLARWVGAISESGDTIRIPFDLLRVLYEKRDKELSDQYVLTLRDFGTHNILTRNNRYYFFDFERASHSCISDDIASGILEFPEDREAIINSYISSADDVFLGDIKLLLHEIEVSIFEKSLEIYAYFLGLRRMDENLRRRIVSKYRKQMIISLESLRG
ncbi:MAG: hypothetical protein COS47_01325 [Candidatus Nealsonbacteria bacterium CG03_land_8_20_14_0_80_36_12]|uniref:Uncharacterized protein n=1 Tax=Candidatus Nealsonbacteria bacterium CG03_land_8_20_14_0_80_36_12 TaxID=1974701 RepID=A0A2M7BYB5_9BACT|nr:MAG: hypothetical protein COS47_01325 [Candidatus Nealsonbacteria bacterium CG03_land_8_20_14_0_80_36_12]